MFLQHGYYKRSDYVYYTSIRQTLHCDVYIEYILL